MFFFSFKIDLNCWNLGIWCKDIDLHVLAELVNKFLRVVFFQGYVLNVLYRSAWERLNGFFKVNFFTFLRIENAKLVIMKASKIKRF